VSERHVGDPNMWTLHNPDSGVTDNFATKDEVDERLEDLGELGESLEVIPPAGAVDTESNGTDATDAEEIQEDASDTKTKESPAEPHSNSQKPTVEPVEPDGLVEPINPDETVEMYKRYEQLKSDLLKPEDYQEQGGDSYITKSGWRKIATAFNVDVDVRRVERELEGGVIRYTVTAEATAPNGKTAVALGMAQSSESNFAETIELEDVEDVKDEPDVEKIDGKYRRVPTPAAVKEHNVLTLASTRAKNRCISDCCGGGEVSAEEVR